MQKKARYIIENVKNRQGVIARTSIWSNRKKMDKKKEYQTDINILPEFLRSILNK